MAAVSTVTNFNTSNGNNVGKRDIPLSSIKQASWLIWNDLYPLGEKNLTEIVKKSTGKAFVISFNSLLDAVSSIVVVNKSITIGNFVDNLPEDAVCLALATHMIEGGEPHFSPTDGHIKLDSVSQTQRSTWQHDFPLDNDKLQLVAKAMVNKQFFKPIKGFVDFYLSVSVLNKNYTLEALAYLFYYVNRSLSDALDEYIVAQSAPAPALADDTPVTAVATVTPVITATTVVASVSSSHNPFWYAKNVDRIKFNTIKSRLAVLPSNAAWLQYCTTIEGVHPDHTDQTLNFLVKNEYLTESYIKISLLQYLKAYQGNPNVKDLFAYFDYHGEDALALPSALPSALSKPKTPVKYNAHYEDRIRFYSLKNTLKCKLTAEFETYCLEILKRYPPSGQSPIDFLGDIQELTPKEISYNMYQWLNINHANKSFVQEVLAYYKIQ